MSFVVGQLMHLRPRAPEHCSALTPSVLIEVAPEPCLLDASCVQLCDSPIESQDKVAVRLFKESSAVTRDCCDLTCM